MDQPLRNLEDQFEKKSLIWINLPSDLKTVYVGQPFPLEAFELFESSSQGLVGGVTRTRLADGEEGVEATTSCDWLDYCSLTKLKKQ